MANYNQDVHNLLKTSTSLSIKTRL